MQNISITVDITVFTITEKELHIVLIKRLLDPYKDNWAIPGGFVLDNETLEEAAYRELQEETGIKDCYVEQLYTFGDLHRDPRSRIISIGYMAMTTSDKINLIAGSDASDARLFPLSKIPNLAFDHKEILLYAIQRVKWKIEYTTAAQYLLPTTFTLTELQEIYEIILGREIDTRNFRKKINELGIISYTGEKQKNVSNRPAKLYAFENKSLMIIKGLQ